MEEIKKAPICVYCGNICITNESNTVYFCKNKCNKFLVSTYSNTVCSTCFSTYLLYDGNFFCSNPKCPDWTIIFEDSWWKAPVICFKNIPRFKYTFDGSNYTFYEYNNVDLKFKNIGIYFCNLLKTILENHKPLFVPETKYFLSN